MPLCEWFERKLMVWDLIAKNSNLPILFWPVAGWSQDNLIGGLYPGELVCFSTLRYCTFHLTRCPCPAGMGIQSPRYAFLSSLLTLPRTY